LLFLVKTLVSTSYLMHDLVLRQQVEEQSAKSERVIPYLSQERVVLTCVLEMAALSPTSCSVRSSFGR
jgi:hypothetical protein